MSSPLAQLAAIDKVGPSGNGSKNPVNISFEFFPPNTEKMEAKLWETVERLAPLGPKFVSVTYGAGGSTRERTHKIVSQIRKETALEPAAHLTCVGASVAEIEDVVNQYWESGVRHIVALRGDPPEGAAGFKPHPDGFAGSAELIEHIRKMHDFEISVGCYPEIHPEALSSQADIDYLKRKVDAGATRAITQFFFDPETYLRFLDRVQAQGIDIPIIPGILPVTSYTKLRQFSGQCGAHLPAWLTHLFEDLDEDPATRNLVAAMVASEQCRQLQQAGIRDFHFYTLNRADLVYAICHTLGVRAVQAN
ncbi:methylenetetrahydrofolate reductase [NAD(P)H] [Sneathiella chinensis]|uniref:Methylenetetrahydrofolate reductase n=1 Tax=Sneathiella chinensis TaxID=349750 RepID=A0ABQ5U7Z1_9PROT|nr:methylenetetrahydrofolate reductase [NAD(P)H] [Sneathiella chinensis]GLQ06581.1 methylenetetrahydrofolate reductase [Sneathiella chinensis]